MLALLVSAVVLVIMSSWFLAGVFLQLPIYLFHSFDWIVSWIQVFHGVGYWIKLEILVLILSWFLSE